jgi:hypothetical protein
MEKTYTNDHHFNPYTLVHTYNENGLLATREWRARSPPQRN